jgi:YD repeat-containing protein
LGYTTLFFTDSAGRQRSVTNPLGQTTRTDYDAGRHGRLVRPCF